MEKKKWIYGNKYVSVCIAQTMCRVNSFEHGTNDGDLPCSPSKQPTAFHFWGWYHAYCRSSIDWLIFDLSQKGPDDNRFQSAKKKKDEHKKGRDEKLPLRKLISFSFSFKAALVNYASCLC